MRLPVFIAWRYFKSGKSHHIINLISRISMVAIAVGTAALIVVLSVFNGFEDLVSSLFSTFDPDIKIEIREGKTFDAASLDRHRIENLEGVISYTEVIEENVLLRHEEEQYIATLKGVSPDFINNNPLDSMLISGSLRFPTQSSAIAGYGVCYFLNISPADLPTKVSAYVPKRNAGSFNILSNAFNISELNIRGVFSIQQDFDTKYVIVPINLMKEMLEYDEEITSAEIRLSPDASAEKIQKEIIAIAGDQFTVKNRFEQQESLYKIMRSEKLAIYLILTFILLIAAFNMIGSQTMVMLDKQKNSAILSGLGASKEDIRKIFISQGIIISMMGALSGLVMGALICFLQIRFGIVKFETGTTFVVDAYPVKIQAMDFLYVFLTVFIIGIFAALFPASKISEKYLSLTQKKDS